MDRSRATFESTRQGLSTLRVDTADDILERYRGTPIADLLATHNLGSTPPDPPTADLLIVTCMDQRVMLRVPERVGFQLRTAGATPTPVLPNVAFAVSMAGIKAIGLVTHTDCAMCRVPECAEAVIAHLVDREGWQPAEADELISVLHEVFHLDDPVQAAWKYARLLEARFPTCLVAPLLYQVDDGALLQIDAATDGRS